MKKKLIHRIDTPGIIFRATLVTSPFWILILGSLGYWAYTAKLTWSDITGWFTGLFEVILKGALFILPVLIIIAVLGSIIYVLTHIGKIIMWVRWNGETKYHFAITAEKDTQLKNTVLEKTTLQINNKIRNSSYSPLSQQDQEKYEGFINLASEDVDTQIKYAVDVLKINVTKVQSENNTF